MEKRLTTYTVDQIVAKTATGRDRDEVARELAERFSGAKPLITREEIDARITELRRVWQQKNQQQ